MTDIYSFWQKIQIILRMTRMHSWNLARFVTIYKTILILLRRINFGKEKGWHSLLAGAIGGYLIFSRDSPVNTQVYLTNNVLRLINQYLCLERGRLSCTCYPEY